MVPSIYRIGFLLIVLRFLLITPSNKSIGFLSSYQYQILDPFRTMTSSICYSLCTRYYMLFDNHSVTHLEDFSSVVGVSSPLCRLQLLAVYLALFVMYSFSCRCCLFGIIAPFVLLAPSGLQVVVVWGFLHPATYYVVQQLVVCIICIRSFTMGTQPNVMCSRDFQISNMFFLGRFPSPPVSNTAVFRQS